MLSGSYSRRLQSSTEPLSRLAASRGLIVPDCSVCRVMAQIPAAANKLFSNLPELLLPQAFISTSSYEHRGFFTPLSLCLGRSGWTNRYEVEAGAV